MKNLLITPWLTLQRTSYRFHLRIEARRNSAKTLAKILRNRVTEAPLANRSMNVARERAAPTETTNFSIIYRLEARFNEIPGSETHNFIPTISSRFHVVVSRIRHRKIDATRRDFLIDPTKRAGTVPFSRAYGGLIRERFCIIYHRVALNLLADRILNEKLPTPRSDPHFQLSKDREASTCSETFSHRFHRGEGDCVFWLRDTLVTVNNVAFFLPWLRHQ